MSEPLKGADTPVPSPTSRVDQAKSFVGDLARPFALIAIAASCAAGLLMEKVTSDKLGLALTAVAAMYGAKAWEARGAAKSGADVEVAKANAGSSASS